MGHQVTGKPTSSGLARRLRVPDAYDNDDTAEAQVAWSAWMTEDFTLHQGISCYMLQWWKANSVLFPLIAKAAKIV